MTIITVAITDTTPLGIKWDMPGNYQGLRSPIPRGIIQYSGTDAIAVLGTGDQTNYTLSLVMPTGYAYLPKNLMVEYVSDDLTNDFNNNGLGLLFGHWPIIGPQFNMVSPGEAINNAAQAFRIWTPAQGTPKVVAVGTESYNFRMADMSTDASTAGDMRYFCEFYVFDVDQVSRWEVNTPIPVISHVSF